MVLVTNRRLRGQGQKFFLLFLGDHLRARVTFTFLIFSKAAHDCTCVEQKVPKKSGQKWKHENGKKKSGIEKEPAAGWSFSGGSLQSSCPGFAAVDFGYSAPSRPAGQQTRVINFFLRSSLIIILRRIVNVKNLFWVEHQRQPVDVDRVRDNVIVLACKRPLVEHRHKVQQEES